jgi:tetratricopeptide (TPR) repeat protein
MSPRAISLLAAWLLGAAATVQARPYVPTSDAQVVETVRPGTSGGAEARLRQLKARWLAQAFATDSHAASAAVAAKPTAQQLGVATAYAREAIEQARREGDPRWLGSAQAALAPWWQQPEPPPAARLLRAIILQSNHDFEPALQDLNALVTDPRVPLPLRAQAQLTRASVLQVRGRWQEAAADCRALEAVAPIESAACLAELGSLSGHADAAQAQLQKLSQGLQQQSVNGQAAWLALMRAELAERRGRTNEALGLYQQALRAHADAYTLGAYADCLLDAGRAAEVVPLLQDRQAVDGLLLRLALAWRALGPAHAQQAEQAVATLQARFNAAHLRGERVHLREEARFELQLKQRPQAALALAQANWAVQKEPADVRVLLQAARAAASPQTLAATRQWVREQGLVDARLTPLLATSLSAPTTMLATR